MKKKPEEKALERKGGNCAEEGFTEFNKERGPSEKGTI